MKILSISLVLLIVLIMVLLAYFKIAERFGVLDRPNERSSHKVPTIRGGGIIFLIAAMLNFFWNEFSYPLLLTALLISGIISFIDDVRSLPSAVRISAHIVSVILIFRECGILGVMPLFYCVLLGCVVIGVINAYNFMDGINGITSLYSLAIIAPLYISETNLQLKSLQLFVFISLLVFSFFNARAQARCFAGDVGSISLAILIVFMVIMRINETGNYSYIGVLLIYGIDAIYTIVQRLVNKENIFKAHRKHLYQYLSNEKHYSHLLVSSAYALFQLAINLCIISGVIDIMETAIILVLLSVAYWVIKTPFLAR